MRGVDSNYPSYFYLCVFKRTALFAALEALMKAYKRVSIMKALHLLSPVMLVIAQSSVKLATNLFKVNGLFSTK